MATRDAACHCGQLRVEVEGDRSPSPFAIASPASCESLAGRTIDALEHVARAIELAEGCLALAKDDSDFDPIRDEPAFQELIGR